jgi:hypothetical protein
VVIILPTMLVVLQVFESRTQLKFLLFPPLAAIGYRMFREPDTQAAKWNSVIAAPVLGSLFGYALSQAGGLSGWTTAVAALGGILVIEVIQADAPPTLAVILLALFAHPTWRFPVSVLTSTVALYVMFTLWHRSIDRLIGEPICQHGPGGTPGSGN